MHRTARSHKGNRFLFHAKPPRRQATPAGCGGGDLAAVAERTNARIADDRHDTSPIFGHPAEPEIKKRSFTHKQPTDLRRTAPEGNRQYSTHPSLTSSTSSPTGCGPTEAEGNRQCGTHRLRTQASRHPQAAQRAAAPLRPKATASAATHPKAIARAATHPKVTARAARTKTASSDNHRTRRFGCACTTVIYC